MSELLLLSGSFTFTWLLSWLLLTLLFLSPYPLLRQVLLRIQPAQGSNLLLMLLALPCVLSLLASLMLFLPQGDHGLISDHCHTDCSPHAPLMDSPWLAMTGLTLANSLTVCLLLRLRTHLRLSRELRRDMSALSTPVNSATPDTPATPATPATPTISPQAYAVIDDERPLAFAIGWWQPAIYLTRGLLGHCSQQDIDIILAHEQAHVQRHDNLRLLAGALLTAILPARAGRKLRHDLHLLTESACDFAAAMKYSTLDVSDTLVKVQRLMPGQDNPTMVAFTGSEIEHRVQTLLNRRPPPVNGTLFQCLTLAGALSLIALLLEPLHHTIEILLP